MSDNGSDLQEALSLFDTLVDPLDAYRDPVTNEFWMPLGGSGRKGQPALDRAGFRDDMELEQARNYSRVLAEKNEFVINALENRINYVVGSEGHKYTAVIRKGIDGNQKTATLTQDWLDEYLYAIEWCDRQEECVRRYDRDGELFLRYFDEDGQLAVRFVEPWQIKTPEGPERKDAAFGVKCDEEDVEFVEGYYIDGELVDASEIQHRKANVDRNVRRGVPTFWPVRRLLNDTDQLMVHLCHLAKVRSSYAVIQKLIGSMETNASAMALRKADFTRTNPLSGQTNYLERVIPGAIRRVNERMEYIFPTSNIGAADYEIAINIHLRAVASRLVMPIWMLTSNPTEMAAYTASLVAESPVVRNFQRLQGRQKRADLKVIWKAIDLAIENKKLPAEVADTIEIQIEAPNVQVRDEVKEAQVDHMDIAAGILSKQTRTAKRGYDYKQEQENIEAHNEAYGTPAVSPVDLMGQPTQEAVRESVEEAKAEWKGELSSVREALNALAGRDPTINVHQAPITVNTPEAPPINIAPAAVHVDSPLHIHEGAIQLPPAGSKTITIVRPGGETIQAKVDET